MLIQSCYKACFIRKKKNCFLPCIGEHAVKGSPVKPALQVQIGVWLITEQRALFPHEPGHGSIQRWFTQAFVGAHSGLMVHSGRQFGGAPI